MTETRAVALSDPVQAFVEEAPHGLLIGGEWEPGGGSFETFDPSTGEPICEVAQADPEDIDRAARAARAALEGPWREASAERRGDLILALADLIAEHSDELAELESLDNGKPLSYSKRVDVAGAVRHLRYYAGWPTKIEGSVIPVAAPGMHCYTRREPVGVCAQIIPWNFPLLMVAWKLAPALAAGCTVLLKPAEQTPLTAIRVGALATEAGFPPGVVNVLTGDGRTGAAMVAHPGVDKVAFTGSTAVGREIGERCGRDLKRVTLELGGKSPNIVLPDADLEAAAKGAFNGIYFNTGQVCNAGSRLFVHNEQLAELTEQIAARAERARVGPALAEDTQFGPVVSAEQHERVMGYIASGREDGAEVLAGGGPPDDADGGWYVRPTLFTGVEDGMRIAREEIFGPVLVAMGYDDLDEVIERANDSEYGLAAGVWTRDVSKAHQVAERLQAGSVYVNNWAPYDPAAPFGGVKASGVGREMGAENLDAYLETKTVWLKL